jgi:hypothetical protein
VNKVRARSIVFLIVNMAKSVADLVILLLRRRGLLTLIAHLLRAFGSHALLFFEALLSRLTTSVLSILGGLLAALLLAASWLRLSRSALRRLLIGLEPSTLLLGLRPLLLKGLALLARFLLTLVLLVLIGQRGLLWLKDPAGCTIAASLLSY